ncbi:hypothetical protein SAMN06295912_101364 [Sphingomonas laterariae]|uniref:Class I SAM-dependent methyltransferase n=1 Tax=Edaphosphingomonas laterariae TaxID=861865 RepID=A0A239BS20_9SPHN|nr:hypothetical protein [Sphingomonas laterariae]SNS10462.1 hypothetical protein SAMN06295912_101364 [Sphingomonas laterariae]
MEAATVAPSAVERIPAIALKSSSTRNIYNYNPWFLLDTQAIERPNYAYCMLHAAQLAKRLGHERISAIEFGVAGGNGIAFMADFAKQVQRVTGVAVEIYGFDTGAGMPDPEGPKDLPYWFRAAQYPMDRDALQKKVPDATLVIGNVRDTVGSFVETYRPAPIGAVFNDVDYWSSTLDSLHLFDRAAGQADHFLPRIAMYFDDIIGSPAEMYGAYNGQLAALREYNNTTPDVKIDLNQNLLPLSHLRYRYQIYYAHLFAHPRYSDFLGDDQQGEIHNALRLQ